MPVVGYVLPEHAAINRARVASIVGHLGILASLFGEYPFLDTKYGIVEGSFSGGMEHPTITLIGAIAPRERLARPDESPRPRAGPPVVGGRRDDADLGRHLAERGVRDVRRGPLRRAGLGLRARAGSSRRATTTVSTRGQLGPTVVAPAEDPFRDTGAVYDKGGWVLHMLRRVVGDETFFAGLRDVPRGGTREATPRAATSAPSSRSFRAGS